MRTLLPLAIVLAGGCSGGADGSCEDPQVYYPDLDGDGFGDSSAPVAACAPPPGHVTVGGDCDDTDPRVHPGAEEICNGIDDNCNGLVDEGVTTRFHPDADQDGWGDVDAWMDACEAPEGWVDVGGDCDDADPFVHPGATEICDGRDTDCDPSTSEAGMASWFDGYELVDITDDFRGSPEAPVTWVVDEPGVLRVCEGTWHTRLAIEADASVVGVAGAEHTVLSAGGKGTVVRVAGEGLQASIEGLTLADGLGDHSVLGLQAGGGLVCAEDASLEVTDTVIEGNHAEVGGGVFSQDCQLDLERVELRDNSASVLGGGLAQFDGRVTVEDAAIVGNLSEGWGGGFYVTGVDSGATLLLTGTEVTDNLADRGGGGALQGIAAVTCEGAPDAPSRFLRNGGLGQGGGVFVVTADWALFSHGCDWGEGAHTNVPSDVASHSYARNFSGKASFACSGEACSP